MKEQFSAYASAARMVRKTRQIVMLYDGAIRAVHQAKMAILEKRIEDRYNALSKASDILNGLQLSLDFENGGEVAKTLYDYYAAMDMRVLSVHHSNSVETCDLCLKHLRMMREAWDEIDQSWRAEEDARQRVVPLHNPDLPDPFLETLRRDGLSVTA